MIEKLVSLFCGLAAFACAPVVGNIDPVPPPLPEPTIVTIVEIPAEPREELSHAQEIWISALEWCESHGNPDAINPNDNDGTPSYYSYQFKPSTFRGLGEAYGVIAKGHTDEEIMSLMKETALQRQIVRDMIKDTSLDIRRQFPGCIAKIGMPPVY